MCKSVYISLYEHVSGCMLMVMYGCGGMYCGFVNVGLLVCDCLAVSMCVH